MPIEATHETPSIPLLRTASLVAGLAILVMALTVPVAEFYIFPKLIHYDDAAKTFENISANLKLFSTAIFIHFTTVICDIVAGWALYIFLKPVNKNLALLSAWFRIANAAFTITSILNLVHVVAMIKSASIAGNLSQNVMADEVLISVKTFGLQWRVMLVFFGTYMLLLGYLVLKADYIPKLMGVCVVLAGLGYIIEDLKYFFYPGLQTGYIGITFFGELIFMFWLLLWGSRIKMINGHASLPQKNDDRS